MMIPVIEWDEYKEQGRQYQITYLRCEGEYRYGAHCHRRQWELVYVSAGTLHHIIAGRLRRQAAGMVQLVRPDDVHELRGRDFSFFNLALPEAMVKGLEELTRGFAVLRQAELVEALVFDLEARSDVEARLQNLMLSYQPLAMVSLVSLVLDRCLQRLELGSMSGTGATNPSAIAALVPREGRGEILPAWLSRAITLASTSADLPTLAILESWCGCSPSHLSRSFRRYLGCTPSGFLTGLRLERAARLLAQTNYPVGHIINQVDFASPNYFHKLFRSRYGLSPRQYRGEFGATTHLSAPDQDLLVE